MTHSIEAAPPGTRGSRNDEVESAYRYARHTTQDSEQHAESLVSWDQVYSQITPGTFRGEVIDMAFLGLQVFRETTNQATLQQGSPTEDCYVIGVPLAMSGPGLFSRQRFGLQHMIGSAGRQTFSLTTPQQFDLMAVSLPKDEIMRLLQLDTGSASVLAQPVVLEPGTEQMHALRNCLTSMVNPNEFDGALLRNLQIQRILKSAVMSSVVSTLGSARPADSPNRSFRSHSHLVNEIVDWAMARSEDPPSVADICLQFHIGRRLLNYSFLEVLGTNPVNYLRSIRLNGARRDLRRHDTRASVREIAARWGFWHLPRFSNEYRKLFGELPSETLRFAHRLLS